MAAMTRELQRLRDAVRRAVPLPDGRARRRVRVLLLAGLSRQGGARRDDRRATCDACTSAFASSSSPRSCASAAAAARVLRRVPAQVSPRRGARWSDRRRDPPMTLVGVDRARAGSAAVLPRRSTAARAAASHGPRASPSSITRAARARRRRRVSIAAGLASRGLRVLARRHRLARQRRRLARREGRADALPRARHGPPRREAAAIERPPEPRRHRVERDARGRRALPRGPAEPRSHPARSARAGVSRRTTSSPRLLAVALAHEPERARLRGRHPRPGRVRFPVARRGAAGRQDGEERELAPASPGADLRRPPDVLRRARAHLPRRPRDAPGTLRRALSRRRSAKRRASRKRRRPGKTIFEYAPDSNAAEDYARVVDRIIHGHAEQKLAATA